MAFINKNDFSIISGYPAYWSFEESDNYFECDDMIAPTISLLNRKGYKTAFCCAGHPFPFIDCGLTDKAMTPEELEEGGIREVYRSEPITEDLIGKYGFEVTNAHNFNHFVEYKNEFTQQIYIAFEEDYEFDLKLIPEDVLIDCATLYIHYVDEEYCLDGFEGITKVYETNKKLYEWAESLPDLNKEN